MPSIIETFIERPTGRTAVISFILAAFFFIVAWFIPLVDPTVQNWYSFLYKDISLPEDERFNWYLVIIESLLFSLFYLFSVIFLGSIADLRNTIPSWFELFVSASITVLISILIPKFGIGGSGISGSGSDTGLNNFTAKMQTAVFWFTILGILLFTLYIIYSAPKEE